MLGICTYLSMALFFLSTCGRGMEPSDLRNIIIILADSLRLLLVDREAEMNHYILNTC